MKKKKEENKTGRKIFIKKFYEKNKITFIAVIIGTILCTLFNLLLAYLFQRLIDAANAKELHKLAGLTAIAGGYLLCVFINGLILMHTRNNFIEKALRQYKWYAYDQITKKSISSFANEETSRYISVLTNDVYSIEQNYLQGTINLILQASLFISALSMMLWYNVVLTLIAVGLSLVPILVSSALGKKVYFAERKVSGLNEGFVGMIKDLLSGFTVIKSFKAENETARIYEEQNSLVENTKCYRRKSEGLITLISGVAGTCVHIGVFMYGAYLAINGTITVGVVIAFVQLMNYILSPISTIPSLLANRRAATGLIDKLVNILEENKENNGTLQLETIGNGIKCEGLSFSYDNSGKVLSDVELHFETGKSYAVVGASGSGKTTLLNLLLGGYENYNGRITYGDIELRDINKDSLYDMISMIQQNVFIFNSTIKNNITMFKSFVGEKVESAVRRAGLSELIATKGDHYLCGENGVGLSGGEKQRISIARSLMRDTPILLMDEATAALDNATAYNVEDAVLGIDGLTRIIVTHKLEEALLKRYDGIVVFSGGKVIEQGRFDELMSGDTYFRSLFNVSKCEA